MTRSSATGVENKVKVIETSIVIHASADRVWMILTDLDNYADWNPFIVFARGHLVIGQMVQFRSAIDTTPLHRGMVVDFNNDDHILAWSTYWITSKILKTVYYFTIEPIDSKTVRFIQRETLMGLIPMAFQRSKLHSLQSYMVSKNKALKRLAENKIHLLPQMLTTGA
jgi:hypothetical protein